MIVASKQLGRTIWAGGSYFSQVQPSIYKCMLKHHKVGGSGGMLLQENV